MKDVAPGRAFPSGANAVVVEGLGSDWCSYDQYSIESATVNFINQGLQTVTEISPQSYCATSGYTLSDYEGLISEIKTYVEYYANNPGRYWGGFMLDEEPGFGISASTLIALNQYTSQTMAGTPGMSWYFTENQPNGWSVSTYNSIVDLSWLAPQVYTSSMASATNSECSAYGKCTNNVTVDTLMAYPWNSASYVTGVVNGNPWSSSYWGSGYWYNVWQPQ